MDADKLKKMRELVDKLNTYSKSYYIDNLSLISDYDFDMMFKELQHLEEDIQFRYEDSPTLKVGSDLSNTSGFAEVNHKIPMGSVENCYDYDSITDYFNKLWNTYISDPNNIENVKYYKTNKNFLCVEPKFDGLSCSIYYQYGKLVQASTRGNGNTGADVTQNIKMVDGVPSYIENLSNVSDFEVRGEVLMPKSVFNRLNEERAREGLKLFANERNAASGSLKQLDPNVTKERHLIFMPYNIFGDIISPDSNSYKYSQFESVHCYLPTLGFKNSTSFVCNVESLATTLESFKQYVLKNEDYCMDGAVVKLNDKYLQDEYGYDKKCPDWCRAMKWKADSTTATTRLKSIEYGIGKTGKLTFTGILDPVDITGTTVSRATLNNIDYIRDLDLHIYDIVEVQRAGEVIPQVIRKVEDDDAINNAEFHPIIPEPDKCPFCGSALVRKLNEDGEEGVNYYCENKDCPEMNRNKIKYYASKSCMDIDTLGDKTIDLLYDKALLKTWKDIYYLNVMDLCVVTGFTVYSAKKLLNAISESANKASASKLLYSIGIDGIGQKTMDKIMEYFKSFDNIISLIYFNVNDDILTDTIVKQAGIGQVSARTFVKWLRYDGIDAINFYKELYESEVPDEVKDGLNIKFKTAIEDKEHISDKLNGKSFLATGTLNAFTRDGIKESVVSNGGRWMSGVSKNLDYLIYGDKAGSKLEKAKKLGIKILTEDEYLAMIN